MSDNRYYVKLENARAGKPVNARSLQFAHLLHSPGRDRWRTQRQVNYVNSVHDASTHRRATAHAQQLAYRPPQSQRSAFSVAPHHPNNVILEIKSYAHITATDTSYDVGLSSRCKSSRKRLSASSLSGVASMISCLAWKTFRPPLSTRTPMASPISQPGVPSICSPLGDGTISAMQLSRITPTHLGNRSKTFSSNPAT